MAGFSVTRTGNWMSHNSFAIRSFEQCEGRSCSMGFSCVSLIFSSIVIEMLM
jgi:hypothetical protein